MHYDFEMKYNKLDSNGNEHLLIPEIDWLLNEAMEMYIRNIAEPFNNKFHGLELNQRTIDSISPIIKTVKLDVVDNRVELPSDYFFYVNATVSMTKGNCKDKEGILLLKQHDDLFRFDTYQNSSFEWREVVGNFEGKYLVLYVDDFTVSSINLTYISRPDYLHNAESFNPGEGYELPSGEVLTGNLIVLSLQMYVRI